MAWDFQVEGWQDWGGNNHEGLPTDNETVHGQFVHAFDSDTGEDDWFWIYALNPMDWDEWYDYITSVMDLEYGMELA